LTNLQLQVFSNQSIKSGESQASLSWRKVLVSKDIRPVENTKFPLYLWQHVQGLVRCLMLALTTFKTSRKVMPSSSYTPAVHLLFVLEMLNDDS